MSMPHAFVVVVVVVVVVVFVVVVAVVFSVARTVPCLLSSFVCAGPPVDMIERCVVLVRRMYCWWCAVSRKASAAVAAWRGDERLCRRWFGDSRGRFLLVCLSFHGSLYLCLSPSVLSVPLSVSHANVTARPCTRVLSAWFDSANNNSAVRQFDAIRRATLHSTTVQRREVNLERAWYEHLKDLVDKFFPGDLAW